MWGDVFDGKGIDIYMLDRGKPAQRGLARASWDSTGVLDIAWPGQMHFLNPPRCAGGGG